MLFVIARVFNFFFFFFFQAEDGIRDAQESRGLGDVYKRQGDDVDNTEMHDLDLLSSDSDEIINHHTSDHDGDDLSSLDDILDSDDDTEEDSGGGPKSKDSNSSLLGYAGEEDESSDLVL
eukprot:TRINITY_DN3986_c0_g1_i8.p1 TRINITY_DN3986_c0_g1~~TRINITY_DN3986_c0_g1_i8.p1  ORF type:complete len:120 (-),score=47.21 TRINITY_DN3986_c0_g1_i8:108-467(-)